MFKIKFNKLFHYNVELSLHHTCQIKLKKMLVQINLMRANPQLTIIYQIKHRSKCDVCIHNKLIKYHILSLRNISLNIF